MKVSYPSQQQELTYFAPKYSRPGMTSLMSYEAPSSSVLFDNEHQLASILATKELLSTESQAAFMLREDLQNKFMKILGLSVLPVPGSSALNPFVHFDDQNQISVSVIFDSHPSTPWSLYLIQLHGTRLLEEQKALYELICRPPLPSTMANRCASIDIPQPSSSTPRPHVRSIGNAIELLNTRAKRARLVEDVRKSTGDTDYDSSSSSEVERVQDQYLKSNIVALPKVIAKKIPAAKLNGSKKVAKRPIQQKKATISAAKQNCQRDRYDE
jgi:hypothetical protein